MTLAWCVCAGASAAPLSSPSSFRADTDAKLAAAGDDGLWLAVAGRDGSGQTMAEVFTRRGKKWHRLPGRVAISPDQPIGLATRKGSPRPQPCLGYSAPGGAPRVRCLRDGRWHPIALAAELRGMELRDLVSKQGGPAAVFIEDKTEEPAATRIQPARLVGDEFRPAGGPVHYVGLVDVALGRETSGTSSDQIDVGVEYRATGDRVISSSDDGDWSSTKVIVDLRPGTRLTGPVRTSELLMVSPAVVGDRDPWPFVVCRWSGTDFSLVGNGSLSVRWGDAQGAVSPVGKRVWATWQEVKRRPDGAIDTRVYASLLTRSLSGIVNRKLIWKGRTAGPGVTQTARFGDGQAVLFTRQIAGRGGLRATVRLLGS